MPIEGMPDTEIHRICRRCGLWFEEHEGSYLAPEVTGPLGAMRAMRAEIDGTGVRFQCARCTRARTLTARGLWIALAVAMAASFVLRWLGVVE